MVQPIKNYRSSGVPSFRTRFRHAMMTTFLAPCFGENLKEILTVYVIPAPEQTKVTHACKFIAERSLLKQYFLLKTFQFKLV